LEDVNNILTSGEVPNLFPKEELTAVLDELRPAAKAAGAGETQEQLAAFFLERVRWDWGCMQLLLLHRRSACAAASTTFLLVKVASGKHVLCRLVPLFS
jgi:hypothetical protein